jgi:hypothetical protein
VKRRVVVAAIGLAAASGILTAGAGVGAGTAQASSAAWYQVYQARSFGFFDQVAAISRTNIWAVGPAYTKAGKIIYRPFVRHFNGRSWQAITIPHSSGSTADWVSASASNNVWVGGLKNSHIDTTVVYRWNGARWKKIPMPALTDLYEVVALGPKNVWAFGTSGTVPYDIFHWNGVRWQYSLNGGTNFVPQGISASAPDDVWVAGFAFSGSKHVVAAYRWHRGAWHRVRMPHPVLDNGGPNVTAVSAANIWIGWYDNTSAHALHWDGHRWHTMNTPPNADPGDIVPDGNGGYWFGATAIWTGKTWASEPSPGLTGGYLGVVRIPRTTSFLLGGGVETGTSRTDKPAIFRFDL